MTRQLVVVLDRNLRVKEGSKIIQIVFLNDDDHFFQAGLQRFLDNQQDRRLGDAVPIDDGE